MKLTLYHYVHCPFCIRVRMALGYLDLPYQSEVVPYDDEILPVRLTGKKMLPIMEINGLAMNESLEIMAALDKENLLNLPAATKNPSFQNLEKLLNGLGTNVHNLAMPYWVWTPEFTDKSREYFQKKKEEKRGPFFKLVKKQNEFISALNIDLENFSKELVPFYQSQQFTVYDILIASHLWGLYVVPEFQFSDELHSYLQKVKSICRFDYHQDFWRG